MIDEAEPLGYPVVVKSTRGHRGQCPLPGFWLGGSSAWTSPSPPAAGALLGRWSAPWRKLWCSPQLCPRCSRFVHTLAGRSLDSRSGLLTWFWLVSRAPLPVHPLVFVEAVSLEQRSLLVTPLLKNLPKSLCCLLDSVPIPHPGGTVSTFLAAFSGPWALHNPF